MSLHIPLFTKIKLFLCFNWAPRHEGVLGSGGIYPRVSALDTIWRWVVSFTPRPLYPQVNSPWYPLDRKPGGPQSRSGRGGEEKNFQTLPGLEPPIIHHWATPLFIMCTNNFICGAWRHFIAPLFNVRNENKISRPVAALSRFLRFICLRSTRSDVKRKQIPVLWDEGNVRCRLWWQEYSKVTSHWRWRQLRLSRSCIICVCLSVRFFHIPIHSTDFDRT
jgi:hypothetical protein